MEETGGYTPPPSELQDLLLHRPELDGFLTGLAELLARVLKRAGIEACLIAVERPRRQRIRAASAPGFLALDDQLNRDGGPAGAALKTGAPVVMTVAVAERGTRPVAAVPIGILGPGTAVLLCLAQDRETPGPPTLRRLESAAAAAAPSLSIALRLDAQMHRAGNLQAALESRTVVDLAAGIIMGQNNCSQQAAIGILGSVSNSRNIKVRNVAAGVVAAVTDRVSTHFDE